MNISLRFILLIYLLKNIPSSLVWDSSFSMKPMFIQSGVYFMAGSMNVPVESGVTADFIVVNYDSGLFV